MTKKWWKEAVVYQIYTKSFCDSNGDGTGDLQGVIQKLDYIQELGVDTVWLNPIYKSPNVDNGYDISDYQDIDPEYGNLDDFKELLGKLHQRGMHLIMDLVVNHTSDEHEWFQKSRASRDNPYRDYYVWMPRQNGKEPNNWGNYFYEGNGSAWEYDETTQEYYLHNYSKRMPDVNWDNPKLRQEMYSMMRWWLDMGVDGFRMDAVNRLAKPTGLPDSTKPPTPPVGIHGYIVDREICTNCPGIHEILQEMNREVFARYDIMTVGETGNVDSEVAINYIQESRQEIDMVFHFEIAKNPRQVPVPEIKVIQKRWCALIERGGWLSQFLSNHDSPRQVSWFANDTTYRVEAAMMLANYNHTMPGTPFVYQGEEIGMVNVDFPSVEYYNERYLVGKYNTMVETGTSPDEALSKLKKGSRDNARTPMQWDATVNAGFTTGKPWMCVNPRYTEINVKQDLAGDRSIYRHYQKLIELRRHNPVMIYGSYTAILESNDEVMAYLREYEGCRWLILHNFSEQPLLVNPLDEVNLCSSSLVLANYSDSPNTLSTSMTLRPFESIIYSIK